MTTAPSGRPTSDLSDVDPEVLANRVATLATIGPDGRPQLTGVWFVVEDGELCMSVVRRTQKARNLERDPRCSVIVYHPDSWNYSVEVRGDATVTDDHDYVFADRLGRRYSTDMRTFDRPDDERVRIALRPTRVVVADLRV